MSTSVCEWRYAVVKGTHSHAMTVQPKVGSGVFELSPPGRNGQQWVPTPQVKEWLKQLNKKDWKFIPYRGFIFAFRHKHDAMMFKLAFAGSRR